MIFIDVLTRASWAFLLGSIPTAFIFGMMKGIDIRKVGSGNIGATNVSRTMGLFFGLLVLLIDVFKGYIVVNLFPPLFEYSYGHDWVKVILGFSVIAGHIWTPFLGFKGGKGVATSLGVLIAITPSLALLGAGAFIVLFLFSGFYVSIGSMGSVLMVAFLAFYHNYPKPIIALACVIAVIVWIRHVENWKRIIMGTEKPLTFRRNQEEKK